MLDSCLVSFIQSLVEMGGGMTLCGAVFRERLSSAFETMVERTQDFTDSAYTSHEHRQKILVICDHLKLELNQLLRVGVCLVSLCYISIAF